jgi:hypothetical protein
MITYYQQPQVRARIIEYLGGPSLEVATCAYLTRCDTPSLALPEVKTTAAFNFFLDRELDMGRSLCDNQSLFALLDIDHVNSSMDEQNGFNAPVILELSGDRGGRVGTVLVEARLARDMLENL